MAQAKRSAKNQRMALVALALVVLTAAALLAAWALRSEASYFYLPADLVAHPPSPDRDVRLGGMVEAGSLHTLPDGVTIAFTVTDGKHGVPVRYSGIVPSLFEEKSGVVAQGHLEADGVFQASQLLAKHDEKYVPREMRNMTDKQARKIVAETH